MGVVQTDLVPVPAVADALRHITVTGVFYCPSYLREPWGGTLPATPGCMWFHAVTSGRCELVVGDDRVRLQTGDLVIVPHGAGHRIGAGSPTSTRRSPTCRTTSCPTTTPSCATAKCDGPLTEMVCGGLRVEHPSARRLLDGLPPFVHVRTARRTALGATLDLLAEEVARHEIGSEAVITRLCDVLVIQAIRHWMASSGAAAPRGCRR